MLIWCLAPLPEDPTTALLMRMLIPAPCQVAAFGETEIPLPKGKGAEGVLQGKKRAASKDQEGKPSKRGKKPSSSGLGWASEVAVELDDEDEPRGKPQMKLGHFERTSFFSH